VFLIWNVCSPVCWSVQPFPQSAAETSMTEVLPLEEEPGPSVATAAAAAIAGTAMTAVPMAQRGDLRGAAGSVEPSVAAGVSTGPLLTTGVPTAGVLTAEAGFAATGFGATTRAGRRYPASTGTR
jgi:hypothetical protein